MVSRERRDLTLEAGKFGRAASRYNLLSRCDAFGLGTEDANAMLESMLKVVGGWREFFAANGVEARTLEMLEQAMLPASFYRDAPSDAVDR